MFRKSYFKTGKQTVKKIDDRDSPIMVQKTRGTWQGIKNARNLHRQMFKWKRRQVVSLSKGIRRDTYRDSITFTVESLVLSRTLFSGGARGLKKVVGRHVPRHDGHVSRV